MPSVKRKCYFRFKRVACYAVLGSLIGLTLNIAYAASPIERQATLWVVQQVQRIGQQQGWQSLQIAPSIQLFNANDRLSPCSTPLAFTAPLLPQSPTRFPLVISCNSPSGSWKIRAQANVEIRLAGVVADKALPAGTQLTTSDIKVMPISLQPGMRINFITQPNDALQMTLKRAVVEGQPLTLPLLSTPRVISRNQPVILVVQQDGLALTTEGVALQNGGKGAIIRVKNSSSGRILSGTVMDAQQVLIHVIE